MLPLLAVLLAAPPALVALPEPATDFTVHPTAGTVAALGAHGRTVTLYADLAAGAATVAKTLPVGGRGVAVAYKPVGDRTLLLALAAEPPALVAFDAATHAEVGRTALPLAVPGGLRVSRNPADPFAYYCGRADPSTWGGRAARVDLRTMRDAGPVTDLAGVSAVELAADGVTLFVRHAGNTAGADAYRLGPPPAATPVHIEREAGKTHVPDPHGAFVVCDREVRSPDLAVVGRTLPVAPVFACAARPLLVAVEPGRAVLLSGNGFAEVGRFDLPAAVTGQPPDEAGRPHVLEVPGRDVLLVCRGAAVVVVPLAGVPAEPSLAFALTGDPEFHVGRPGRVSVTPHAPGVTVALVGGPPGLALAGGALAWTPSPGDAGRHAVRLRLSAGATTAERDLTLTVRHDGVALPFAAQSFALAADGLAVAAGAADRGPPRPFIRLATADLTTGTVHATRALPAAVGCVAADRHAVYAGAAEGGDLVVFDRTTLAEARRVPLGGRVRELTAVADRLLFALVDREPGQPPELQVLAVPALTPADATAVGSGGHVLAAGVSRAKPPQRTPLGWWFDGCLYGDDFRTVVALVRPPEFLSSEQTSPTVTADAERAFWSSDRTSPPLSVAAFGTAVTPWGLQRNGYSVHHDHPPGHSRLASYRVAAGPAAVFVYDISARRDEPWRLIARVVGLDGNLQQVIPLRADPVTPRRPVGPSGSGPMVVMRCTA